MKNKRKFRDLKNVSGISQLKIVICKLWQIIDNIDTFSDMVKNDDKGYRKAVEKEQAKRWKTGIKADGHSLDFSNVIMSENTPFNLICPICSEVMVPSSNAYEDGSGWSCGYICGCTPKMRYEYFNQEEYINKKNVVEKFSEAGIDALKKAGFSIDKP